MNDQLELLKNLQAMAEKSPSIEIFREQLKVIVWGLDKLVQEKGDKS